MDLRSDDSGFLVGGGRVSLSNEKERLQLLRAIKADTAAVRKAVTDAATTPRLTRSPAPSPNVAARTARVARAAANDTSPQSQQQAQQRSESVRRRSAQDVEAKRAATPQRGENGRFQAGSGSSGEKAQAKTGQRKLLAGIGSVLSSLKSGFTRMGDNTDSVDPTIAAAKEFGSVMSPITKPFRGLMGAMFRRRPADVEQKVSVPWYRRIWGELRGINQKSGTGRGGGGGKSIFGRLGGLLGLIPGLGLLGKMFGKGGGFFGKLFGKGGGFLGKIFGKGGMFGKGGSLLGGLFGKAGGLGKLLKRIPILGALLSGGSALASIFGLGGGTKEERFKGAGGGIGALIGGAIGTLLGPLGTVVGGILGDLVGTKVGEWLSTVDWGKVGETITSAWSTLTGGISEGWKWVQEKFGGALETVTSALSGLKEGASKAFDAAASWGKEKATAAKEAVQGAVSAVAEKAAPVIKAVSAKAAPVVKAVKEKAGNLYEAATIEGGRLMGKLDKGYRHKEKFDGIKGGEGLAKYGSYTNDEADRIRELKKSGANTSANLKGGMPQDIRNKIIAQATAAGLNPEDMLQVAALESGGNPNAISSTGATGVYQMTGQTATGLGITNRFDADQNIAGGMKLAQANADVLRKRGMPVNRDNLYMMHQLGPTAATDLIQGAAQGKNLDQLSAGTQTAASMNYGKGAKTAKEYLAKNSMALDARLGQVSKTVPATLAAVTPASAAPAASAVPMVASAAASLEKQALAPVPTAPRKIGDNSKKSEPVGVMAAPLTQNVADRGLAQAATGGIGMNLGVR